MTLAKWAINSRETAKINRRPSSNEKSMNLGKISSFAVSGDVLTLVMQSQHKSPWQTIGLGQIVAAFRPLSEWVSFAFRRNGYEFRLKPTIAKTNTCTADDVTNISRRSSALGGDDGSAFVIELPAIRRQHNSARRRRTISWSNVLRGITQWCEENIFRRPQLNYFSWLHKHHILIFPRRSRRERKIFFQLKPNWFIHVHAGCRWLRWTSALVLFILRSLKWFIMIFMLNLVSTTAGREKFCNSHFSFRNLAPAWAEAMIYTTNNRAAPLR